MEWQQREAKQSKRNHHNNNTPIYSNVWYECRTLSRSFWIYKLFVYACRFVLLLPPSPPPPPPQLMRVVGWRLSNRKCKQQIIHNISWALSLSLSLVYCLACPEFSGAVCSIYYYDYYWYICRIIMIILKRIDGIPHLWHQIYLFCPLPPISDIYISSLFSLHFDSFVVFTAQKMRK